MRLCEPIRIPIFTCAVPFLPLSLYRYDVFDVGPPFLVFTITLDVEVKVDAAQGGGWAPLSKITLSPSSPVGRAGNGRVRFYQLLNGIA